MTALRSTGVTKIANTTGLKGPGTISMSGLKNITTLLSRNKNADIKYLIIGVIIIDNNRLINKLVRNLGIEPRTG